MMYADLIDEDDFCAHLRELGIRIPREADLDAACTHALHNLDPQRTERLRLLADELLNGQAVLLPAVHQAITARLLPAL